MSKVETEGAAGPNPTRPDPATVLKAYFITEIRNMMHGLGDASTPLLESACLLENVVKEQIRSFIIRAADVSSMRGAKSIGPQDILFLLRNNPVKLQRILKYVALKDIHANVKGAVEGAVAGGSADSLPDSITSMKRSRTCIDFLTSIDQTGELTDSTIIPFDVIKHQRDVRAEKASKEMDTESYLEFSKARRASFVSPKSAAKFREWLKLKSDDDGEIPKILKTAYELLGFVAYELVAELVELALIVRKDKARGMNQPFSRYMPGIGYSSTGGVDSREAEMTSPLTPAEFHEAIRRCRSSPVGHANLFTRRPNGNTYPPLLSF